MNLEEFKLKYQKQPVIEYSNSVSDTPLVSVCVQTYQHVNYIKECLEGILMQKTSFPFEILLGEDASTDGTREVCLEYAKKYPDKIKLFLHHRENNIKINGSATGRFNLLNNLYSANGNYIALCEGDDYWTDPLKLQKQVDFLEKNEDYVICGHDRRIVDEFNNVIIETGVRNLNKQGLLTLTVVFRNHLFDNIFFNTFIKVANGDSFLFLYFEQFGKTILLNFKGANYRIHSGGIWSSTNRIERYEMGINTYTHIVNYFMITKNIPLLKKAYYNLANIEIDYGYYLMENSFYKKAFIQFLKYNKTFISNNLNKYFVLLIKINILYIITLIKKIIG
ncbi:glycosyltransferase involved in cell wall biosynthesis [Lutibacter oceani]|uniref:Glycosyltransferase involved in cell wall biosynthesis n=1 Tax=Lutibacter oceani TaxID=1853311 RepID=A0A3D9S191_9FLAO|nr:glycosyltransferase [Lutibacter oceani]REE83096.1 glycosyltransferase involved in cell wall biosynthesis [Lutibacter oceani]